MKKRSQIVNYVLVSSITISTHCVAEVVDFTPFVETGLIYSDNVYLSSEDDQSSLITSLEAGLYTNIIREDKNITLEYDIEHIFYSHDSDENDTYQRLFFFADKTINYSGFKLDTIATISNIAESNNNNPNADIYSKNTIERKTAEIGLSFITNPKSDANLAFRAFGVVTDNEDDIGNYNGYGATLKFNNGLSQKTLFWESNGLYDLKTDREDDSITKRSYFNGALGYQTKYRLSPLIRLNYENYEGISALDSDEMLSWGPGLRYFLTQESYFEVSYNFSDKDGISDFVGGGFFLAPSPRLLVNFYYDKRYFGDAYDFSLIHQSRRMTNTITYTEDTENFDRDFYSSDDDIEVFTLNRRLEWLTELSGRLNTYAVKIFYHLKEPTNKNASRQEEDGKGISLMGEYILSRRLGVSSELTYSRYSFENDSASSQDDEYFDVVINGNYKIYHNVFSQVSYEYNKRKSNLNSRNYNENRLSVDFRVEW